MRRLVTGYAVSFMEEGLEQGQRPELAGGGLVPSVRLFAGDNLYVVDCVL